MCIEAIEAMLRYSEHREPGPRLVLWCIAWHINRDSGDWPITLQEMMAETALSRSRLYVHLKALERSGEIIVTHRRYRPSIYQLRYFAGRFAAADEQDDELSTADEQDDELSTLKSRPQDLTASNKIPPAGFNSKIKSRPQDLTASLNPAGGTLRGRIPYTGILVPEEDRPEGDPLTDLSTSIQYRAAGPFARWQMEREAAARATAQRKMQ